MRVTPAINNWRLPCVQTPGWVFHAASCLNAIIVQKKSTSVNSTLHIGKVWLQECNATQLLPCMTCTGRRDWAWHRQGIHRLELSTVYTITSLSSHGTPFHHWDSHSHLKIDVEGSALALGPSELRNLGHLKNSYSFLLASKGSNMCNIKL